MCRQPVSAGCLYLQARSPDARKGRPCFAQIPLASPSSHKRLWPGAHLFPSFATPAAPLGHTAPNTLHSLLRVLLLLERVRANAPRLCIPHDYTLRVCLASLTNQPSTSLSRTSRVPFTTPAFAPSSSSPTCPTTPRRPPRPSRASSLSDPRPRTPLGPSSRTRAASTLCSLLSPPAPRTTPHRVRPSLWRAPDRLP